MDNEKPTLTVTKSMAMGGMNFGVIIGMGGSCKNVTVKVQANEEVVIGRNPEVCRIVIKEEQISRRHCGVRYYTSTGKYGIIDYSKNGTFLSNGHRISSTVWYTVEKDTRIRLAGTDNVLILI